MNKSRLMASVAAAAVLGLLVMDPALAEGFGKLGNHWAEEGKGAWGGVHTILVIAGLGFGAVGVIQMMTAKNRQQSPMVGFGMILGGAALAGITTLVGLGSYSVTGDDGGSANIRDIMQSTVPVMEQIERVVSVDTIAFPVGISVSRWA